MGKGGRPSDGETTREHAIGPNARKARLDKTRALKMARSAHAYVRGATVDFYRWLETSPGAASLPVGPPIWICGDCHLGNLGPLADAEGRVKVQIRDLDQNRDRQSGARSYPPRPVARHRRPQRRPARRPPPRAWSRRWCAATNWRWSTARATRAFPSPTPSARCAAGALGRHWKHLARERLEDVKPTIPLGKRFWELTPEEHEALEALFASDETRTWLDTPRRRSVRVARAELVDAAYWMKGCSSLGTQRFAALLELRRGDRLDYALVDLKEAAAAAAPAAPNAVMPDRPRRAGRRRRESPVAQPRYADAGDHRTRPSDGGRGNWRRRI